MNARLRRAVPALCLLLAGGAVAQPAPTAIDERSRCTEEQSCWDCRVMGNHVCGDLIFFARNDGSLHAYELNAPDRPGCFVEPSDTPEGYEVIFYSRISGRGAPEYIGGGLGFEVPCPF